MKAMTLETPQAKILVVDDKPENLHLLDDALGNARLERLSSLSTAKS